VESLQAEERYGGSVKFLYIAEIVLLLTTVMLVGQDTELGQFTKSSVNFRRRRRRRLGGRRSWPRS